MKIINELLDLIEALWWLWLSLSAILFILYKDIQKEKRDCGTTSV